MNKFDSHTILENTEIIAKELKRARLRKRVSLDVAAKQLRMNIVYLEALESGDFDVLPTGVYRLNFLREYAFFLGISASDLISLFPKDDVENKNHFHKDLFVKKASRVHYFVTIPKVAKNLLMVTASMVCFVYLAICVNAIISPPELSVISPSLDVITNDKEILVEGSTDPDAEVSINDELVLSDSEGMFLKKINLKTGLNTIVIVAHKKYGRKNELVKKILVKDGEI